MTNALSIHIRLNRVDPAQYSGWSGELIACEADANSMEAIAKSLGYSTTTLLTEQATATGVINAIRHAASVLQGGDICFITNSSHGGQVPDRNGDEADGRDETWAMFDREIIDDELYALWASFAAGVRIVVLSDSCHSGTVTRARAIRGTEWEPPLIGGSSLPAVRAMPEAVATKTYAAHQAMYEKIQQDAPTRQAVDPKATVLLISGCQDNQVSLDGVHHGLFTSKVLEVWAGGTFTGSYAKFHREIVDRMPPTQTPKFTRVGAANSTFVQSSPFSL